MFNNSLSKIGMLLVPIFLLLAGWAGSRFWERYSTQKLRQKMHAEIASIRSYEESFNLRRGHYLLLPDSCLSATGAWRDLGRDMPPKYIGCFSVSANGSTPVSEPVTSPTMVIVAESIEANIRGIEGGNDSMPTWSKINQALGQK